MKRPNFFIVGFPKAGTTALAQYLSEHKDIFISKVKEPHYFCEDLNYRQVLAWGAYEKLFNPADNQVAIGEASTGYVFSDVAVKNILKMKNDAKFIVMIRNPVEMCVSFHGELVFASWETVLDLEKAWELQEARKAGTDIPTMCPEPRLLQYADVCRVGFQVKRLLETVSDTQVLFVIFDDFIKDPLGEYKKVLAFLGVEYEGRNSFPPVNSRKNVSSIHVQRLINMAARIKGKIFGNRFQTDFRKLATQLLGSKNTIPPINPEFKARLALYFKDDVQLLSGMLGRDLTHWLKINDCSDPDV